MSEVETVVKAVEAEVTKVEGEVVAEVKKIEADARCFPCESPSVKAEAKKLTQVLSADEKLMIREVENSYLKAQMEIQRLSQITQKAQQDFTKIVEDLTRRYLLNPAEWLFDNVSLEFKKK
jgi:hypothetical protein